MKICYILVLNIRGTNDLYIFPWFLMITCSILVVWIISKRNCPLINYLFFFGGQVLIYNMTSTHAVDV